MLSCFSHIQLFATLWVVLRQAPLFMGFSRQEYWSGGEGTGNLFQYFCLENPRDGGAWWATVYGVAQSQTRLKRLSSSSWGKELREASSQKASKEMKPSVQPQPSHFRD